MKKSWLIFLVVLISGCVGSQSVAVDVNRGLTIASFSASPSVANSGEAVLFDIEVENIGGTTARNSQIDFFGVEGQWRDSLGNIIDSTLTQDIGTLKPPVPERSIAGQSRLVVLDLMTPDIPQGISPTLTVEARVTYNYNTSGFIDVIAVGEDEFRRKQITGQQIKNPVIVTNSAGPIHMTMDSKFAPIRVDTTSSEDTVWPLRIILTNVGDGFPITPEDDERIRGAGGKIIGTIELLGPAEFENCLGETSGTFIDLESADIALRLRETGSVPIACSIRIDNDVWNKRPEDRIKLIFNLFYRYYVSETTTVQVIGR